MMGIDTRLKARKSNKIVTICKRRQNLAEEFEYAQPKGISAILSSPLFMQSFLATTHSVGTQVRAVFGSAKTAVPEQRPVSHCGVALVV